MIMDYSDIYNYWNHNLCNGGNLQFPYFWGISKVLEIGCGNGNDAIKFISQGRSYFGIDLTDRAVEATKRKIRDMGQVYKMNAETLDFPDNHFDMVYSWGVIHHALNPEKVISEIYRVLKPYGFIYIMLYNKLSFRYLVEICILRRILWWLHYHKFNEIRKSIPHPTKEQWISINTDNVGCPLSRVYTEKQAKGLLKNFRFVTTHTRNYGWYRIIWGRK